MNISFFATNSGSGRIRGEQIANYLGAKLNPKEGFENDICIYIKDAPPKNYPKRTYIDVLEDSKGLRWAKNHPEIGIIASSKSIYQFLKDTFLNIVLIPEHHCNFERIIRERKEVRVAGIVGNKFAFQYPVKKLAQKLKGIGIELKTFIKKSFSSREEVVEAYKQIDIQLVWRPKSDGILRNPLKLSNACSFGIPTVAFPEVDFVTEYNNYYIPAFDIDTLVEECQKLKEDERYYRNYVFRSLMKSEEYHISTIAKLYRKLNEQPYYPILHA